MKKIGVIIGSIRKHSFSERVAKALVSLFPEGYEVEYLSIAHLPLYNQDYDDYDELPAEYVAYRKQIVALDAVIFVTPEHNRSIPAALKNALDIPSRPAGDNLWAGKPALIASQSPGAIGGFGANHHLRQVLAFLDLPVVQQPELYLTQSHQLFGEDGEIENDDTKAYLQHAVDTFIAQIQRYSS